MTVSSVLCFVKETTPLNMEGDINVGDIREY